MAVRLEEPERKSDLAVLYLHGFGSSQAGEKAELFRARCRERGVAFCSFDFQGHGASDGWMFDLTLSRNQADIARVHAELQRRGYRRLVLFGSSMGGLSGLWYAARHPKAVHAAIHLAPALGLEETFTAELGADPDHRLIDRLARLWALTEEFLVSRGLLPATLSSV